MIYNPAVLPRILTFAALVACVCSAPLATSQETSGRPQVKVNVLNVCSPSADDRKEIDSALSRIPVKPAFDIDLEISRGRSVITSADLPIGATADSGDERAVSRWVRIRRDFVPTFATSNTQYSFSVGEKRVAETLVWHFREAKDILQVSLSDTVDVNSDPAQVAKVNTPVSRIRIERFGKSSVVLARCPNADQSAMEPLFSKANSLMTQYRRILSIKTLVPGELARIPASATGAGKTAR